MSRSYVNILITILLTQRISGQLCSWNGCQNSQNINSIPSGSNTNIPVASNGVINGQQNGFGQQNVNLVNELQSIPKLAFVNDQITDLIQFASKVNKRQLTENSNDPVNNLLPNSHCSQVNCLDQGLCNNQMNNVPITFYPSTAIQNNVDNMQSSNLCSQVNFIDQNNNNQPNNIPITFYPSNVVQNNVDGVLPSNPFSQVNCLNQDNNVNQFNNIPITFYPNLNSGIQNNLIPNEGLSLCTRNNPVPNFVPNNGVPITFYPNIACNNALPNNVINNIPNNNVVHNDFPIVSNVSPYNNVNTNNYQQNKPVPFSNLLVDIPKINSLILTGEACNNGLPFSVLPANLFNAQDMTIYSDIVDNGYKIPRSLPTETSYPANNVENNVIPIQNNKAAMPLLNNVIGKLIPANNNMANYIQDFSLNNGQHAVMGNNIQESVNSLQPPVNQNNYNIPTATNWPAINTGNQLTGNSRPEMTSLNNLPEIVNMPDVANYNLPDLENINMLNLGELGTLPIFSGLPVIGITETVSIVNPEQLSHHNEMYGIL